MPAPTTPTTAPQHPPVANADFATTDEDTPIVIAVLANDIDADGDPLTIVSYDRSSRQGGIVVCAAGSCTYTPPADYSEGVVKPDDSFSYRVSDGTGLLATGIVSVDITEVNDPPRAVDDNVTTLVGTFIDLRVLANDYDVEQAGFEILAVDATGVAGTVYWQPGLDAIYYTAPPVPTTDVLTYEIIDVEGLTASAVVTIVVNP